MDVKTVWTYIAQTVRPINNMPTESLKRDAETDTMSVQVVLG